MINFWETSFCGELIEYVAEGNANGEEVPELGYGVGGLTGVRGGGKSEIVAESMNAHEAGTEGRTLLVKGGRLVSSFVEEGVVGHGSLDLEPGAGDDGLFAACDRSH